ncbi:MAG: integrase core domain-containing protein [Alphaproteobacteria bacterium]|nr:integrase core domain-containing protein [Alphaproteobacteria bacterium]
MTAKIVRRWLAGVGAKTLYIEPGSSWENGYRDSFHGKLRDELLNGEILYSLNEAQIVSSSNGAGTTIPSARTQRCDGTRGNLLARLASLVTGLSAGQLIGGAKCPHKLTLQLDCSVGAGQAACSPVGN